VLLLLKKRLFHCFQREKYIYIYVVNANAKWYLKKMVKC
jgi:hypothetical protein